MFESLIEFINDNFWLCLVPSLAALAATNYHIKRIIRQHKKDGKPF